MKILCTNPTKTLTFGNTYIGIPVNKGDSDGSYNGRWTRAWTECPTSECTSYKIQDDLDITRYVSKKRFKK